MAGPTADLWDPQTTFEEVELASDERPYFREPFTAVIAGKDDQSIVCARTSANRIKDAADACVQTLHHLAVNARIAAFR